MEPFMAVALKGFFFVVQKCCSNLQPIKLRQYSGGPVVSYICFHHSIISFNHFINAKHLPMTRLTIEKNHYSIAKICFFYF